MRELQSIGAALPGLIKLALILLLAFCVAKFGHHQIRGWRGGVSAQDLAYLAVAAAALKYAGVF